MWVTAKNRKYTSWILDSKGVERTVGSESKVGPIFLLRFFLAQIYLNSYLINDRLISGQPKFHITYKDSNSIYSKIIKF